MRPPTLSDAVLDQVGPAILRTLLLFMHVRPCQRTMRCWQKGRFDPHKLRDEVRTFCHQCPPVELQELAELIAQTEYVSLQCGGDWTTIGHEIVLDDFVDWCMRQKFADADGAYRARKLIWRLLVHGVEWTSIPFDDYLGVLPDDFRRGQLRRMFGIIRGFSPTAHVQPGSPTALAVTLVIQA